MGLPKKDVTFATLLAEVMAARGISQSQLGDLVGRSQKAVSDWVTGNAEPPPTMVFALEAILSLSPGALSRCLGYVPVSVLEAQPTVEDALLTDPTLDESYRLAAIASYREYQRIRNTLLRGVPRGRQQADGGGAKQGAQGKN